MAVEMLVKLVIFETEAISVDGGDVGYCCSGGDNEAGLWSRLMTILDHGNQSWRLMFATAENHNRIRCKRLVRADDFLY